MFFVSLLRGKKTEANEKKKIKERKLSHKKKMGGKKLGTPRKWSQELHFWRRAKKDLPSTLGAAERNKLSPAGLFFPRTGVVVFLVAILVSRAEKRKSAIRNIMRGKENNKEREDEVGTVALGDEGESTKNESTNKQGEQMKIGMSQ